MFLNIVYIIKSIIHTIACHHLNILIFFFNITLTIYITSINTKYISDIKNIGCMWNAFEKLKFTISLAKVVPLHAIQSIPNLSLNTHLGIKYVYFDFKNKNDVTRKIIINICTKIRVLYCFFIVFTFWLYIILYIIVKY